MSTFTFPVLGVRLAPHPGRYAVGDYAWDGAAAQPHTAGVACPFCQEPMITIVPVPAQGGRVVWHDPVTNAGLVAPWPAHVRPLCCEACEVYFCDQGGA